MILRDWIACNLILLCYSRFVKSSLFLKFDRFLSLSCDHLWTTEILLTACWLKLKYLENEDTKWSRDIFTVRFKTEGVGKAIVTKSRLLRQFRHQN